MDLQQNLNPSGSAVEKSNLSNVSESLQFFNYHEYLVEQGNTQNTAIVVNHFPNFDPIVTKKFGLSSLLQDEETRTVVIPRVYHTIANSDIIPQFSLSIPGSEEAALVGNEKTFTPKGQFDGCVFGVTSLTPLVPDLLLEQAFQDIVNTVNQHLVVALDPFLWQNATEAILDIATFTLYSRIYKNRHERRKLQELEDYIARTNESLKAVHPQLKITSPRHNGYLSVSTFHSFFLFFTNAA